jgi:folate-dependent tRNA-U54 methylase TrmFO/GidA
MNVNFGLFPPLPSSGEARKRGNKTLARKQALATRTLADLDLWLKRGSTSVAAE